MPPEIRAEILALAERVCAGDIEPSQNDRLEELVAQHSGAADLYWKYIRLHICLGDTGVGSGATTQSCTSNTLFSRRVISCAAAIAILVAGLVIVQLMMPMKDSIATLDGGSQLRWMREDQLEVGARLHPERLSLERGVARISYASGIHLTVEAPVEFTLVSDRRVLIHHGRAVFKSNGSEAAFELVAQDAVLKHVGTEYGIMTEKQSSTLQVYDGTVIVERPGAAPGQIVAGEAVEIVPAEKTLSMIAFDDLRFIRTLPDIGELAYGNPPVVSNPSHDSLQVTRAAASVEITGSLNNWDFSHAFVSKLSSPYEDYFVEGAMQWDDEFLYIAGRVGDPYPLRSVMSPERDNDVFWKGGAVQVRLCLDPALTTAKTPSQRRVDKEPTFLTDKSDAIVHLTLWYCAPKAQPSLCIQRGMDFHSVQMNPNGYRAAFKAANLGYQFEYAIPWRLIGEKPPANNPVRGTWQIHWADGTGRVWRGHMLEIGRAKNSTISYQDTATWGQFVFTEQRK